MKLGMKKLISCACLSLILFGCGEQERINGRTTKEWIKDLDDLLPEKRSKALGYLNLSQDMGILDKARPRLRELAESGEFSAASLLFEKFGEVDGKWAAAFAQYVGYDMGSEAPLAAIYATDPKAVSDALIKEIAKPESSDYDWKKQRIKEFLTGLIAGSAKK